MAERVSVILPVSVTAPYDPGVMVRGAAIATALLAGRFVIAGRAGMATFFPADGAGPL